MRGEPFPMSSWERAVLESLERIELALQRRPAPDASAPREQKREEALPIKPSKLLALRSWAEGNGVTRQHTYAMAKQARMPVIRLGRRIYVHLATMETWVQRGARSDDLVRFELADGGWITRLRDDLDRRP
jgi:hypothetical protein